MAEMTRSDLGNILAADRARFNGLFAQARLRHPRLDPALFAEHLRTSVEPIVTRVIKVDPTAAREVVNVLYELSLELVAKEALGPAAKRPDYDRCWREALVAAAKPLAKAPRRVAASITNALHHLFESETGQPASWVRELDRLAEATDDVDTFLQLGEVAAWRAGLAQLRTRALALCRQLLPPLALAGLNLDPTIEPAVLYDALSRLEGNPWLTPYIALDEMRNELQIVARLGAFRGFGGRFLTPPHVQVVDDVLVVHDAENAWSLTADVFGASWQRFSQPLKKPAVPPRTVNVAANGRVTFGKASGQFDELRDRTSYAATAQVLAVTVPLSHVVYLIALVP